MPAARPLVLPEPLLAWLDRALPQAHAREVHFRFGPRLPFDWLPGDRARFTAITLWRTVHVRDRGQPFDVADPRDLELVLHELVHVAQYARLGEVGFPLRYLTRMAQSGYERHPLEREAREQAAALRAAFLEAHPGWGR